MHRSMWEAGWRAAPPATSPTSSLGMPAGTLCNKKLLHGVEGRDYQGMGRARREPALSRRGAGTGPGRLNYDTGAACYICRPRFPRGRKGHGGGAYSLEDSASLQAEQVR